MKYQVIKMTDDDDDAVLATFVTYEDALLRIATIGKESRGFLHSWHESDAWEQVDPTTGKVLFALVIQAVSTRDALVTAVFQRVLRDHAEGLDALAENDGPVR